MSNASGNIDGSVSQKAIPSGAVVGTTDTQTLTNKTIDASQLVDGTVLTAKIADAAITPAKLSGGQSGSAPIYGARAWVNFNGTGTVAIRASGNVSSITDNGTGSFTVNFTTALPNANYAAVISGGKLDNGDIMSYALDDDTYSTTQLQITGAKQVGQNVQDTTIYTCAVFG